jgi:hypothetical protein
MHGPPSVRAALPNALDAATFSGGTLGVVTQWSDSCCALGQIADMYDGRQTAIGMDGEAADGPVRGVANAQKAAVVAQRHVRWKEAPVVGAQQGGYRLA